MGGTFRFSPMLGVLTEPLATLPTLAGERG